LKKNKNAIIGYRTSLEAKTKNVVERTYRETPERGKDVPKPWKGGRLRLLLGCTAFSLQLATRIMA